MQKINQITQPIPENFGMPDHTQLKQHDNTVAFMDV